MTKEELQAELTRSRAAISRDFASVRQELDYSAKLGAQIRRKPLVWFGGAAAVGWILAGPKTKTRVVHRTVKPSEKTPEPLPEKSTIVRAGAFASILAFAKFLFPLAKPFLASYATRRFAELAERLGK